MSPECSPLYRAMLGELERFLGENEVPRFVARSFRGYLDCGLLAKGFVWGSAGGVGEHAATAAAARLVRRPPEGAA